MALSVAYLFGQHRLAMSCILLNFACHNVLDIVKLKCLMRRVNLTFYPADWEITEPKSTLHCYSLRTVSYCFYLSCSSYLFCLATLLLQCIEGCYCETRIPELHRFDTGISDMYVSADWQYQQAFIIKNGTSLSKMSVILPDYFTNAVM